MLGHFRTYGLVTIVTVLIWVLLEAESLRVETVAASIQLRQQPSGTSVSRIVPPDALASGVKLTIEGPTEAVSRVVAALRIPVDLTPGAEVPSTTGEQSVDLKTALRSSRVLRDSGVTIARVEPESIVIRTDNLKRRRLKVRVEVPNVELAGVPEVSPPEVDLILPEELEAKIKADTQLFVRLDSEDTARLARGQRETLRALSVLFPPELADALRAEPPVVDVMLSLQDREATVALPSVPVHIRIPPAEYAKWDIEVADQDQVLRDVTIRGLSDAIERLRAGRTPVVAYVAPTFDELERAARSGEPLVKEAQFSDLPTTLRIDVADRLIQLRVRPRALPLMGPEDEGPQGS